MATHIQSYELYFRFIEKFVPTAFQNIDPNDPLIIELEKMMEMNDQFFSIVDMTEVKYIYTSKGSSRLIGIEPDALNPSLIMLGVHPDDVFRLSMGRAKLMSSHKDLFI